MKRAAFYLLTVLAVLWMQILNNHFLGGSGFSCDWVLIAVIYFGLFRGPLAGETMGFVWGLLIDASSLGLMGMHTLLYAGAGYLAGMLRRQLDGTKVGTQAVFSFGVSILYGIAYVVIDHLFVGADRPFSWMSAARPFVNGALAPVLFWILARWSGVWAIFPVER